MTPTERLQQALRATSGACNDHDYICHCRPVDVRGVLAENERLTAELAAMREAEQGQRELAARVFDTLGKATNPEPRPVVVPKEGESNG